ncbi:MAG: hypothetical protein WC412_04695 [Candidatus Omnitrophota bacterium]|jgi:hypothetical protein
MKYIPVKPKTKKASALVFTLIVIAGLLIYAGAFVAISINQNLAADIFKRRTAALNLAEAGLDHGLYWLRLQPQAPTSDNTNPWGGVQSLGGGTYSVVIDDLGPIATNPLVRKYKVTSTGTFGNFSRVLENYIKVNTFGQYLWWTNMETFDGTNVWFWTQDHLSGQTHTNNHFNIYGDPIFGDTASSVDPYIYFYNGDPWNHVTSDTLPDPFSNPPHDEPDFQGGINVGATYIDMPEAAANLRASASDSANGGLYLSGNSTVVFNSAGTITVTNKKKACTTGCVYTGGKWRCTCDAPSNGALFVNNGTLTISGTVNARMTIGASSDVIINNNVVYADDPRTNPASNDSLGIISERDVVINDNISAYDLEIDAAIMALNTSFMLNNWATTNVKGTLTVYGGIIQKERGPVGTFYSSGQKASGYSKEYIHDPRFTTNPPPFMPNTGDYDTVSWREN